MKTGKRGFGLTTPKTAQKVQKIEEKNVVEHDSDDGK